MRVFIGMETSGELRRRFIAQGHDVFSCDVLPSVDVSDRHLIGDVFETLESLSASGWWPYLAVFHPTCTYLTASAEWAFKDPDFARYPGVGYHQRVKPGTLTGAARREARAAAIQDVQRLFALPISRKVIENPQGAISSAIRRPSQVLQPYEHGDDASKKTCLWFVGPNGEPIDIRIPVDPAKRVAGRIVNGSERWSNQTDSGQNRLSPSENRWRDRSKTFPGIADAIALTFGRLE